VSARAECAARSERCPHVRTWALPFLLVSGCRSPIAPPASPRPSPVPSHATTVRVPVSDRDLESWLRSGCGPVETTPESPAIAALGAKLSKTAPPITPGTIVHARGTELWVVSSDGSRRRRLKQASPGDEETVARWSPSGDALAFVTHHGGGDPRVVLLSPTCAWARVLGPSPIASALTFSTDGRLLADSDGAWDLVSGQRAPRPGCFARCVEESQGALRVVDAEGGHVEVTIPKMNGVAPERVWSTALSPDGRSLFLLVRYRTLVDGGLVDTSPVHQVGLPETLPKAKGPPLVTRLFAAGFTPIREGWLSLSPTGTHLVAVGESALEAAPGADAQWVDAKSGKTIDLGSTYGLVGPRSWIAAASWAPDGSKALLSVASCADASTAPGCAAERRDLIAVDAKRAVFVASGSRASWHQVVLAE